LIENNKIDISKFTKKKIKENAYSIAIDNMFIAKAITESENYDKLNEWEGKILEDSYKILKNGLIEWVVTILDDNA
jgi:Leu/Phe-tRNA-protein transferase